MARNTADKDELWNNHRNTDSKTGATIEFETVECVDPDVSRDVAVVDAIGVASKLSALEAL